MKEDGMYIKYAIMRLLMMGYQSRLAVLSPSYYGVPQVKLFINDNLVCWLNILISPLVG